MPNNPDLCSVVLKYCLPLHQSPDILVPACKYLFKDKLVLNKLSQPNLFMN